MWHYLLLVQRCVISTRGCGSILSPMTDVRMNLWHQSQNVFPLFNSWLRYSDSRGLSSVPLLISCCTSSHMCWQPQLAWIGYLYLLKPSRSISINTLSCAVASHSVVSDSATPWTVAGWAPMSMGILRQDYWSGLPYPAPVLLQYFILISIKEEKNDCTWEVRISWRRPVISCALKNPYVIKED